MSLESDNEDKVLFENLQSDKVAATTPKKTPQQDNASYLSRIYWSFVQKKKLKFSHQFPSMKQNEITNKIIREWSALSMEQKLKLGETYNLKQEYDSDEDNRSDYPLDSRSQEHKISDNDAHHRAKSIKEQKIILQKDSTGAKHNDEIKLNIEDSESQIKHQQIKDQEDSGDSQNENQHQNSQIKKQIGSKPRKPATKKNKPIKKPQELIKLKNGEYLLFYKHYYSRLKSQHPKWSSIQINHIIKLLWKKKQQQNQKLKKQGIKKQKAISKQPTKTAKPKRPISGKQLFTREKKQMGMIKEEIDFLWKQLPRESKNDWNKRGTLLGSSPVQKQFPLKSNTKSQASLKTEENSSHKKVVISFKDVLLKGGFAENQSHKVQSIVQEKHETPKRQVAKKQSENQESEVNQKKKNLEYISLAENPLNFMRNKMNLEKIILE